MDADYFDTARANESAEKVPNGKNFGKSSFIRPWKSLVHTLMPSSLDL